LLEGSLTRIERSEIRASRTATGSDEACEAATRRNAVNAELSSVAVWRLKHAPAGASQTSAAGVSSLAVSA